MGHIAAAEARSMIQHYFGPITSQQQQQLTSTWVDGVVSPAALEALCAEHDTVGDLLNAIQGLVPVNSDAAGHAAAACAAQAVPPPTPQQALSKHSHCSGIEIQAVSRSAAISAAGPNPFVAAATTEVA